MQQECSSGGNDVWARVSAVRALLTPAVLAAAGRRAAGGPCSVIACDVRPAAGCLTGFLGDHFRVTLRLRLRLATPHHTPSTKHLFVKTSSLLNNNKAAFIDQGNFFRRERLLFSLFDELGGGGEDEGSWHVDALYHSERLLVMFDASTRGYRSCDSATPLDAQHAKLAVAALARYHAAFANLESRRSSSARYHITSEHGDILQEHNFKDCLWLRAGARLVADLTYAYSARYQRVPELHAALTRLFLEACATCRDYPDTLNVLIHKDPWPNNILFRYQDGAPTHALLIDYQCVRYAPPAFDLMVFLYLNTSADTRLQLEQPIIEHYYEQFVSHASADTGQYLQREQYDACSVRRWCERARMFGAVVALAILPYTLMSGADVAVWDQPATFQTLCDVDRAPPVLQYAARHQHYRHRLVQLADHFIHTYLLNATTNSERPTQHAAI